MILKALFDYYNRCDNLAPEGLEYKEISFIIVIDKNGHFVRLEDRRIDNKNSNRFLVLKSVEKTSNPVANVLWDNCSYVLGLTDANFPMTNPPTDPLILKREEEKRDKEIRKNQKNHKVFLLKIEELMELLPNNTDIKSIQEFYLNEEEQITLLQSDPIWDELRKNFNKYISFMIDGDSQIIATKNEILYPLLKQDDTEEIKHGICLITGENSPLVNVTSATSILGSQAKAKLVSFQVSSGYDSYGKDKCGNSPISRKAEFAYTTALNRLVAKDSKNKFHVGSRTFLFWSSSNSQTVKEAEDCVFQFFSYQDTDNDDPNARIETVHRLFKDIYSGVKPTLDEDRFYFLGLAPNSARIAVVYWNECSLKEFSRLILRHFDDMSIADNRKEKKSYQGLHQMMSTITLSGKASEVQPNLPEATIKSIMQGVAYPSSLFQTCIRRIRSESSDKSRSPVNIVRAAILKAYLNRLNSNLNIKIKEMLDKQNNNPGYLCGRLFATLEKIQEDANRIHSIRERYMNAASSTPSAVFSTILNLSAHHLEKLTMGSQIFYEKLKQDIIDKLPADGFPSHLDLLDQGRFFVGYYQQRQFLYTSKDSVETN